jgi:acetyl/propionyl-CoA carboxylase alpha subunit/acetyl-CoA carboxylase carboxyltransferase component
MTALRRLAIIDRPAPAMRCISAAAELNHQVGERITTIALYLQDTSAWIVREADEAIMLSREAMAGATGRHNARLDPARLVAVLAAARADSLWAAWELIAEPAELARLCERAGIAVVGPSSEVFLLLSDQARIRQLAEGVGLAVSGWPGGPADESATAAGGPAATRYAEVQVVADGLGTVWAVGVRDSSIRQRNQAVIVESACTPLDETGEQALRDAAIRLCAAVGYRGTGSVEFLVDPATRQFSFVNFSIGSPGRYVVTELTTGLDLATLQLDIARGRRLSGGPPLARGHAIAACLAAVDPEHAFVPAPGRVAALQLPGGAGIHVDVGVTEGEEITAESGSVIATIAAWGQDRRQALSRLHHGLTQSIAVVDGGTTNKAFLLALLNRAEVGAGSYDHRWLDRLTAAGELAAVQDPVALLQAAIEAAESDQAALQAAFYAAAARGRPEWPADVGHLIELSLRGNVYRMHVCCLDRGRYQVDAGDGVVDVAVQHVGRYERIVTCLGRPHRVVVGDQWPKLVVEVDGVPHVITRHSGGYVRAPAPALVVMVHVAPGDTVRAGDPLVMVESMKMETAITAPHPGTVHAVFASVNTHVEAGAPLVQLRPPDQPHPHAARGPRLRFVAEPGHDQPGNDSGLEALRSYLLGYDVGDDVARELAGRREAMLDAGSPPDRGLLGEDQELLEIFADITALARREPGEGDPDEAADDHSRSPEGYLFAYLACLDPDRSGLPEYFLDQLRRTLARYGVQSLRTSPELEQAVARIYRSVARVQRAAPVILVILGRWLYRRDALTALMTDERLAVLDRLIASTQQRHHEVCDLARDVRFSYVDAPVLASQRAQVYAEMEGCLDELAATGETEPGDITDRLVWCPLPMRALLRDRYRGADAATRARLLQVRAQRFYRIRELRQLRCEQIGPHLVCLASYAEGGQDVQLVHGYVPLEDLPDFAAKLQPVLGTLPHDRQVVVDLESWRTGERLAAGPMAAGVAEVLARTDFGRVLHRLDITLTSASGPVGAGHSAEHLRTQHFTYSCDEAGFREDPLYRNMHPMIAERLDLWRLSNFELQRMSSAEDVYLFHAVARDNPKDQRLIAIAEARDLSPARDSAGRVLGFPHLEAMLAQAFADIRHTLGRQWPEQRPPSSRVILYVRPAWDVAPEALRSVAHRLAPAATGLGLEKITVRIRTLDQATGESHEAVLDVENVAEQAVTVRRRPVSGRPIQPLTEYRQKLLRSQRLGVPYPYELIRALTPPRDAPADFPVGEFTEYDLDAGGQLTPVSRPYGRNLAGIVIGVITSYTALVPEGMRRVAILSDPTSGLGNLAEGECRRILAALTLARRLQLPVEWYAVSSGARIAWDSGTENMDWIAAVLRGLIEFTQSGGQVNVVVTGINVGGQPYWNAAATMLMRTQGILVMTPASAMVLTGKNSLEYSGAVSAEDNFGIGGFDRIMGPNGQSQYWAPTLADACVLLLRHYEHVYIVPGESSPRRAPTGDPFDRDVCASPLKIIAGSDLRQVGDIFSAELNGKRKKAFFMRSLMRAVTDADHEQLERWARWRDAENAIIWEAHLGGIPVCLIGFESHTRPRTGYIPADGPPSWTSGTLFPQAARKVARALNAASGNRPVVILANLSGFDGSPESMRTWELEYGAEIGGAVTNFRGPIVLVVVSRYHGGAFVVFSKRLHEDMETAAVVGSYASVIGGAPAAATVFAREVSARTETDPRVTGIRARLAADPASAQAELRHQLADTVRVVRAEKLKQVADDFDRVHDIRRAREVGSVDHIIAAADLRPFIIGALERLAARAAPQVRPATYGQGRLA